MDLTLPHIHSLAKVLSYCIIAIILHTNLSYAQYENVWIFGFNNGLDFNNGIEPKVITSSIGKSPLSVTLSNASICDAHGALLFYTDGSQVFDRLHNLMPNGDSLTPIPSTTTYYNTATATTDQGTIIIPIPDHPKLYYVFSLLPYHSLTKTGGILYYSIVDMNLNRGWGDVVAGSKGTLVDSNLTEHMTAVAGENCNIWLLNITRTGEFKALEISAAGISNTPIISNIAGFQSTIKTYGYMIPSSDRKKIALAMMEGVLINSGNGLSLFDFDPASGMVTNEQQLSPAYSAYSVCFSADDTKLYFVELNQSLRRYRICQLDLKAGSLANIINSTTGVAITRGTQLRLAPNNKIYFFSEHLDTLSVINYPDQLGIACQPQEKAIALLPITFFFRRGYPNIVPVLKKDSIITQSYLKECNQDQVTLTAQDTSGRDYIWNDGVIGKSRSVTHTGTYWVSYNAPCVNYIDSFNITFNRSSYYNSTRVICADEQYNFNGRWFNKAGRYQDTLTSANGCDSIVSLDLIVLPSPAINISTEQDRTLCIGDTVLLEATGADNYQWYHNDRVAGNKSREYINLSESREVIVVTGQLDNGCRDTAETIIMVDACCELFIPNAFSPNGDGINDEFSPVPYGHIQRYGMQIFNRWGQLVFSTFNINNQWNGFYKGIPAESGTYFYYIAVECVEGKEVKRKGDVTLIR